MPVRRVHNIPAIIHRTWKDRNIPEDVFLPEWVGSWERHNPDWEFRFYTDDDIDAFMQERFPDFAGLLDGYDQQIKKVDAFRYFLLHEYGGVYVDLDFECFRPLDGLIGPGVGLYLQQNRPEVVRVTNSIMISAPGHPFWEHAFRRLVAERDMQAPANVHTGPHFVTRVLEECGAPDVRVLEFGRYFYPRSFRDVRNGVDSGPPGEDVYGEHKFAGTW